MTEPDDTDDGGKLKEYCIKLYDTLADSATEIEDHGLVWQGKLTDVVAECGIPKGWYTLVTNNLYQLRCLERIQTGTRYQPSVVKLIVSPAEITWKKIPRKGLTTASRFGMLQQQIDDVRRLTGGLDIVGVFRAFEERQDELIERLDELERQVNAKTKASTKQAK